MTGGLGVTVLRRVMLGCVLATPWVPCLVSEALLFPYVSAKGHLFRVLVAVAVACWAGLMVKERSLRPRTSPILVALASLVAVLGLAGACGVWPALSLLGNLERMEGWLTHLHLFGFFVVLAPALASAKLWRRYFELSLAASVVVAAAALAQLAGLRPTPSTEGRLDATLGNPSFLAVYLAFHIWLAVYLAVTRPTSTRLRLVLAGIVALEGVALFHTATRSVMLGVLVGAVTTATLVLAGHGSRPRLRGLAAVTLASAVALVGGLVLLRDHPAVTSSPVLARFAAIAPSELTSQSRLLAYRAALEGAVERPWLGWGQETFRVVYARHYDPRLYTQDPYFDRVHNVFLEALVAGGLAALLAFGVLLAAYLRVVWRPGTFSLTERSLLTGLAAGYAVNGLLLFDTLTSLTLGVVVLAHVHWRANRVRWPAGADGRCSRWPWAVVVVALVALSVASVLLTWRTVAAERAVVAAVRGDPSGLADRLVLFRRALRHRTPATPEVRERLLTAAVEAGRVRASDGAAVGQLAALARHEMTLQLRECPLDVRSQVAMAAFLWRFSAFAEAEALLLHAHGLAPRMQRVLFELGTSRLEQGRANDALEAFRAAYELEPGWAEARSRYAAAAVVARRPDLARELLEGEGGIVPLGEEWLIAAFRTVKDLPRLIAALEDRLAVASSRGGDTSTMRLELARAHSALAERVMADGFESGETSGWSGAVP